MTVIGFLKALQKMQPNDPYIIQQLALATYKSEVPDKLTALQKAKEILSHSRRRPRATPRPSAYGARCTSDCGRKARTRPTSTRRSGRYARGYFFKNDQYNGINFAFLLDVRASLTDGDEAIADRVLARRIRREILAHLRAACSPKGRCKEMTHSGCSPRRWRRCSDSARGRGAAELAEAVDKAPAAVDGRDHARADRQAEGAAVVSGGRRDAVSTGRLRSREAALASVIAILIAGLICSMQPRCGRELDGHSRAVRGRGEGRSRRRRAQVAAGGCPARRAGRGRRHHHRRRGQGDAEPARRRGRHGRPQPL